MGIVVFFMQDSKDVRFGTRGRGGDNVTQRKRYRGGKGDERRGDGKRAEERGEKRRRRGE